MKTNAFKTKTETGFSLWKTPPDAFIVSSNWRSGNARDFQNFFSLGHEFESRGRLFYHGFSRVERILILIV